MPPLLSSLDILAAFAGTIREVVRNVHSDTRGTTCGLAARH